MNFILAEYKMFIDAAERKKELLPFATAWMELENIMLSEIFVCERQIPYDITYKRISMNRTEPQSWKHGSSDQNTTFTSCHIHMVLTLNVFSLFSI